MSYINAPHYAILMHFSAVPVSVTLRGGQSQYIFMKQERARKQSDDGGAKTSPSPLIEMLKGLKCLPSSLTFALITTCKYGRY